MKINRVATQENSCKYICLGRLIYRVNGSAAGRRVILARSGRVVFFCLVIVLSIGIGMVPSIVDVWGYDREFCSSSSSPSSRVTQKPNNIK